MWLLSLFLVLFLRSFLRGSSGDLWSPPTTRNNTPLGKHSGDTVPIRRKTTASLLSQIIIITTITMNSDDYYSNKTSSKEGSQSLSMLLEAAGGPTGSTDRMNESIQRSLTGGGTVSRASVESATRSRPTNNNDEAPHGSSANLSVLASVAQDSNGNAAASAAPAQPLVEARVARGSSSSAAPSSSHESAEKQRAALLATVKSLSNDPLVQLSMMRAMQQQQVSPDVVIKNKEKQAALALKANARKRKPATGGPAQLPMKSQRVPLSQGAAPKSRPASTVRQAAPQAGLVQAQQPQFTDMSGLLAGLLSEQTQPNVLSNQVPQINRNAQSGSMQGQDSNPPRGGLPSIQSLLGALQQQHQQLGLIPALFNVPPSTQDNDGGISSLIQNLISSLTPQQQLDLAQSLIPQSMGPVVVPQQQPQPKTLAAAARPGLESSLSSCQKDSDISSGRSQSSQAIRIPCRARGMPLDHNFEVCRSRHSCFKQLCTDTFTCLTFSFVLPHCRTRILSSQKISSTDKT